MKNILIIWSNSTYLVSSGLFILGHSNSKFSNGTHKGIYGDEIVRLNKTYTVGWSFIKISYTINTLNIYIPTLSPCLLGPGYIFWAFKYQFPAITWLILYVNHKGIYGPRREKTCLLGFREKDIQTSLVSYRDLQEKWNFGCSKSWYYPFKQVNNKGADQSVRMRRLVCVFGVGKPPMTGFLALSPIWYMKSWSNFNLLCKSRLILPLSPGYMFYVD